MSVCLLCIVYKQLSPVESRTWRWNHISIRRFCFRILLTDWRWRHDSQPLPLRITRVLSEEALVSRVKLRHVEPLSVFVLDGESESYVVQKQVLYASAADVTQRRFTSTKSPGGSCRNFGRSSFIAQVNRVRPSFAFPWQIICRGSICTQSSSHSWCLSKFYQ
jgi:hypothetical protein